MVYVTPQVEGYDSIDSIKPFSGKVDNLVVIPSRNAVSTIAYVISMVREGLEKLGGDWMIIVIDGLSDDGTLEIVRVMKKKIGEEKLFVVPNTVSKGKGGAMKLGVDIAYYLGVNSLVFVDSDLRSITPEWIELLARGAVKQGYTTPLYIRDRFDATITNFVARPLTVAAYMVNVKQPIGGDFGLGDKLIEYLATEAPWYNAPWNLLFGTDIFITHSALSRGIVPAEAYLGSKIHEAKDPGKSLKNMFIEVTGSLYTSLIEYAESWTSLTREELVEPPIIESPDIVFIPPPRIKVDKKHSLETFKELKTDTTVLGFLNEETRRKVIEAINSDKGIDHHTWAQILVQAYRAFYRNQQHSKRKQILETLYHLWQGRLYEYYNTVEKAEEKQVEEELWRQVKALIDLRPELIEAVKNFK